MLLSLLLLGSFALATQELVTPRLRVLYETPELADYAQRVASEAENALDVLIPLFDFVPPQITLKIDDSSDIYNAVAPPLPRPQVALPALFPGDEVGLRTRDEIYLLLLHELTHSLQLSYIEGSKQDLFRSSGLVGSRVAPVPPSWFLEGIATWAESRFSEGGRLNDARTTGLLQSLALAENWPTLTEAGLISYSDWPGGQTRYLLGAGFVTYLIEEYGFEAVLKTLRRYNERNLFTSFAQAWQQAVGSNLASEWEAWRQLVRAQAEARAALTNAGESLTDTGWYTAAPALSPDEKQLAWVSWPPAIVIADLAAGLAEPRQVIAGRWPAKIAWLDERTLVYARLLKRPGTTFSELFALDITTGRERQLTSGARARLLAVSPDACVLFVRDTVADGSQLKRWCADQVVNTVWQAPAGEHIVGLAVSEQGQIALSMWRQGFVDLALLESGYLRYLTQDAAQDLEPVWRGEHSLVFRSDRTPGGVFDLYELNLAEGSLRQLSNTLGGAFSPEVGQNRIWYQELNGEGYNIAAVEPLEGVVTRLEPQTIATTFRDNKAFEKQTYSPWSSLAPYGWLPLSASVSLDPLRLAASAAILGQDDSGKHSYDFVAGYDSGLTGYLGGAYLNFNYRYKANSLLNAFQPQYPLGFGLRAGLWPQEAHLAPSVETAFGLKGSLRASLPLDTWTSRLNLELGTVYLQSYGNWQFEGYAEAAISNQRADFYGYRSRGLRAAMTGLWTASSSGPSQGAWLDVSNYQPVEQGTLEFALRAGYRPAWNIPISLDGNWGAMFSAGYRRSFALAQRYDDGLYALERLTLNPRLRTWLGSSPGLGADLSLSLDTVLNYGAPLSFSATLGYADGLWYRLGLSIPY